MEQVAKAMIGDFVEGLNNALVHIGAPTLAVLSETFEDYNGTPPRISVYPTTETFDYVLQVNGTTRSIVNRVVSASIVVWGEDMACTEALMHSVVLAMHTANYGQCKPVSVAWDRDTKDRQLGRKSVLSVTFRIPVTRLPYVHPTVQTRINITTPEGAAVSVELATVRDGVHVQAAPSAVWHCVFAGESVGVFQSCDAGSPVVTVTGPRSIDLTFSAPAVGRAYFVQS